MGRLGHFLVIRVMNHKSQMQDTGKFRTNTLDKYYTTPGVALRCCEVVREMLPDHLEWVEPSAGSGVFLLNSPPEISWVAMDIEPEHPRVIRQDFLEWDHSLAPQGCVVVGNPPFGRQSTTAKSFIRKCCRFADAVAFILPLSFSKPSMQKAFPAKFHLERQEILGRNAFTINGDTPHDVPCVLQVWVRKDTHRTVDETPAPQEFRFVKAGDEWDVAIRRVGVYAGRGALRSEGLVHNQNTHYFLHTDGRLDIGALNAHTFPTNTTGPRSLSKGEVTIVVNNLISGAQNPSV